jgi:hypothetical protein
MRTTGNINIYDGFNFCTTLEQSKQLLELGLNPETSDMTYLTGIRDGEEEIYGILPYKELVPACRKGNILYKNVPAWTYYKLLTLLPKEYILLSQRRIGITEIALNSNIPAGDIISVNLHKGVGGLLTIIKNEAFIERINKEFLIKENMDTTWTNLRDKLPEYYCKCLIKSVENLTLVQRFYVVSYDLEMRQFYHIINDNIFNDSTFEIDDNHEYYYIVIPD